MKSNESKITFDKDMLEKLHNISIMAMRLIYGEIEKLCNDGNGIRWSEDK